MKVIQFIKNWTLPIAMFAGAFAYFAYTSIHALDHTHAAVASVVSYLQPALIFAMLFISFCKVDFRQLRPRRWMLMPLSLQSLTFVVMGAVAALMQPSPHRIVLESAMLCMICPTATAAAVVTSKLNGNSSVVISYTCVINLAVSLLIPSIVPLLHEASSVGMTFETSFLLIIGKVFPLLIMPLVASWLVGHLAPHWHRWVREHAGMAFYIWAFSLALAIAVSVKAIVHSTVSVWTLVGIAVVSLVSCLLQFGVGRIIGRRQHETVAGTQMLGQKNTVFIIWAGYTFMHPVTAVAGGFYSVWHNVINSWQLYKARRP